MVSTNECMLMGAKRWVLHIGMSRHLRREAPLSFEVREEVVLADEPWRADFLLLRRTPGVHDEHQAGTLKKLWPMLPLFAILEYKSPRRPYRRRDLDKLIVYVHGYFVKEENEGKNRLDLCGVLAVPHVTPSLLADVRELGFSWENLGDGYHRLVGSVFVLYVVELDVAGVSEQDDVLYGLGSGTFKVGKAYRFLAELIGSKEAGMSVQDCEDYEEMLRAVVPVEHWMALATPEQRLQGLAPEQRLQGLDREQQVLALPLELLRLLPNDYFQSLAADVQAEVRRRLG